MPFIVAELSANHNGSLERALKIIKAASLAGADAVKFQTFKPERMAVPYKLPSGTWKGRDLIDLYKEAQTPYEWHKELFEYARSLDLIPFSSPFHEEDVEFLEKLDCPIYKIASFELVDLRLIEATAKTGKPLIMSTGMADTHEIRAAVNTARKYCKDITLLHCISSYPTPINKVNLRTMNSLKRFNCKIGISDHTQGSVIPIMATTLGAEIIEKHITLTKEGLDKDFSLDPKEFKSMVNDCRAAGEALGKISYGGEGTLRRSLYYAENLPKGTKIEDHHIKSLRPALGISPLKRNQIIGRILKSDVTENEPIK